MDFLPTTTLADVVGDTGVMDLGVRPLWTPAPRLSGPAYTVRCAPGDNLMLHTAIYRAEPGSVLVVQADDLAHAVAGGNVCAIAQRRGIAGFVVDGVVRDVGEIREAGFPVFARGVVPVPGSKATVLPLQETVRCGGVDVHPGDWVVADEDGVIVVAGDRAEEVATAGRERLATDAVQTLDEWEAAHRVAVDAALDRAAEPSAVRA